MLLSGKCDSTIKYNIDTFRDVISLGNFFGVNSSVTFDDVKLLLWNKLHKDGWIVGKYIVVPDADMPVFNDHKYVKLCDIDHLICAYLEHNHI